MFYVLEITVIGPRIRETFKSKELASQYVNALFSNDSSRHYQIVSVVADTEDQK